MYSISGNAESAPTAARAPKMRAGALISVEIVACPGARRERAPRRDVLVMHPQAGLTDQAVAAVVP